MPASPPVLSRRAACSCARRVRGRSSPGSATTAASRRPAGGSARSAVFADTTRPRIVPAASYRWRASAPEAAFAARIADRGAGLAPPDQSIFLDGRRVPAEYDPEAGRLTWRPRARPSSGTHSLRIEAVDRLGNRSVTTVKLEVE
jgi:hypothetical protein